MAFYDFKVRKRKEGELDLAELKGKVVLVVNTATGCGFTPQYEALEELYKKYHEKGLEILDFPCNQFGHQAPGTDEEIHEFCTAKYNTTFDQFKKIDVNGENEDKLYTFLKSAKLKEFIEGTGHKISMKFVKSISTTCKEEDDIKWNFTKFLVNKNGEVIFRVSPVESPLMMEAKIIEALGE